MTSAALEQPEKLLGDHGSGAPPLPPEGDSGRPGGVFGDTARVGLLAFIGTVSMLFIGFTSAVVLRRTSADWQPLQAPALVWVNTFVLIASSLLLEGARRALRGWNVRGAIAWFAGTGLLGLAFVAGQLLEWRQLSAAGVFLSSHPHSSFFYLLSGVHALHVVSGLAWYAVAFARLRALRYVPGGDGLGVFATYWHFLAGLWIYLVWLIFVFSR